MTDDSGMRAEDDPGMRLADHVVQLRSTDPDAGFDDLLSLANQFATTDVVGLGEATHGAREFFELRHRLTRFLVEELGFRAVALEASLPAALAIHDYVLYGEGDAETAVRDLNSWFWKTEGSLALIRWLREFNEGRPFADRVHCYGIDVGDPSAPAARIRKFLRDVDPGYYETIQDELDELVDEEIPLSGEVSRRHRFEEAESLAADVSERIEQRREEYVEELARDHSYREEYARERASHEVALVEHLCRAVAQTCEWLRAGGADAGFSADAMEQRDRKMAENVAWCFTQRDDGAVVWAHNGHVKRGRFDVGDEWGDADTMGEALDREFGDRYLALGSDFSRGTFRAIASADDAESRELRAFSADEPLVASATARLDELRDELDASPFFLDVAAASDESHLASWFERPRRVRAIGSAFDPTANPDEYYVETDLSRAFDGLFFVGEIEGSRPLD